MASRLEARRHGGRWLLRLEDLDSARCRSSFADHQLRTLEALGLTWDGAVLRQSQRAPAYREALARLAPVVYPCWCTRSQLARQAAGSGDVALQTGYPGTCRDAPSRAGPAALRLRLDEGAVVEFSDLLQGPQRFALGLLGDPVVCGRNGVASYQLAVVLDDALQGVTDVVRGSDLLSSTAWQLVLQRKLGLTIPRHLHVPLVCEPGGAKLAKSRHSLPLDPRDPVGWLHAALVCLRQDPPAELQRAAVQDIWDWADDNWDIKKLRGLSHLESSRSGQVWDAASGQRPKGS